MSRHPRVSARVRASERAFVFVLICSTTTHFAPLPTIIWVEGVGLGLRVEGLGYCYSLDTTLNHHLD